jgi:hypothetical protein
VLGDRQCRHRRSRGPGSGRGDVPTAGVVSLLPLSTPRAANPTATRAASMATDAITAATTTTASLSLSPSRTFARGESPRSSSGVSIPPIFVVGRVFAVLRRGQHQGLPI